MSLKDTDYYKSLDLYKACECVEWSEDSTEDQQTIAWQWIADTGSWRGLQGWYGRTVNHLQNIGVIE
jgi:hypothetical protein